jgi:hypothetical protein
MGNTQRMRTPLTDEFTLSRYPPGCRFAFTIVHDADSAYSERLRPLFDVFDSLGLKLTVTAFAFWADWARDGAIWEQWRSTDPTQAFLAPKAVPLADPAERAFYQHLAAHGHEIGLHTPSETSDTRDRVRAAFELFKDVFARYPTIYVEHSARTNRDGLANEGADPTSAYYCLDVLRHYGPWLWIDDDSGLVGPREPLYFQIPPQRSPFNRAARQRYGTDRAFVRTGRWQEAHGDGFLEWYSEANIDALARDGGIALVYMHLDARWLDPQTRTMRTALRERLRYLAAKPGWFAPAGVILDRVRAVDGIRLSFDGAGLRVQNTNSFAVDRLVVVSRTGKSLAHSGRVLRPDAAQQIVVESIAPSETLSFGVRDS